MSLDHAREIILENFADLCHKLSSFYCLFGYETNIQSESESYTVNWNQQRRTLDLDLQSKTSMLYDNVHEKCEEVLLPIYEIHNIFHKFGCCKAQCNVYRRHGFDRMILTPVDYVSKLTDYNENNKSLIYIQAFYNPRCRVNVITKIGFGIGVLLRTNHTFISPQLPGVPYVLGNNAENLNLQFPYENPGGLLNFTWFKSNVICREQSWICDTD